METEVTSVEVDLLSTRMGAFDARITRINKLARKLGVPAVTVTILGTYEEVDESAKAKWCAERVAALGDSEVPDFTCEITQLRIDGETPKLSDHRFIATIDTLGIVFGAPGAADVPQSLVDRRGECDHCGLARPRNETFVVQHEVTGKFTLVGRQCLGDFLGSFGNDPHKVWAFQRELWIRASDFDEDDSWGSLFGRGGSLSVKPVDVLNATYKVIKVYGWQSASAAYNNPDMGLTATASRVRDLLFCCSCKPVLKLAEATKAIEVDAEYVQKALTWAQTLEGDSDYVRNLRTLSNATSVSYKHIGFVASIISGYDRETERDLVRAREVANQPESTWVGEVGDRITFENATLNSVRELDGNFGITYLHKFTDADGNDLVWFASNDNLGNKGAVLTFKATIKRHGDYKGRKNTIINRAKAA